MVKLESGENFATILEEGKVSQKIRKAQLFQEGLEAVGRNDLDKRLDQVVYPGKP